MGEARKVELTSDGSKGRSARIDEDGTLWIVEEGAKGGRRYLRFSKEDHKLLAAAHE